MIKLTKDEFIKINIDELSGKVLCFVTDTIWGVGVMVDDNILDGLNKIYQMKKRDSNKPLAVLVDDIDQFNQHVEINEEVEKLFSKIKNCVTLIFGCHAILLLFTLSRSAISRLPQPYSRFSALLWLCLLQRQIRLLR